jgi:ornithine--oxo-acid transaminase
VALAGRGLLAKDTHGATARFAPPITIEPRDLHYGLDIIERTVRDLSGRRRAPAASRR